MAKRRKAKTYNEIVKQTLDILRQSSKTTEEGQRILDKVRQYQKAAPHGR